MSVFDLHNVCIAPRQRAHYIASGRNPEQAEASGFMEPLIIALAHKYPLWQFHGDKWITSGAFEEFIVLDKDEPIGRISKAYVGGVPKYVINNDRIATARKRGDGYRTNSVDKAVFKVKKLFSRKTTGERLNTATLLSEQLTYGASIRMQDVLRIAKNRLGEEKIKFVDLPDVYKQFCEYARKIEATNKTLEEYDTARMAMLTTMELREQYNKRHTTLVVRDVDEYIVKTTDGVKIYMDHDLPNTLRGKIGMLKLVEANVAIANIGMKLNDDMFLLLRTTDE